MTEQITVSREFLRQVVDDLMSINPGNMTPMAEEIWLKSTRSLQALEQPAVEPSWSWVCNECGSQESDIAGAVYDFAGFLTTQLQTIEIGSTANASPIADLIKEWAELRDLNLEDANVEGWNLK